MKKIIFVFAVAIFIGFGFFVLSNTVKKSNISREKIGVITTLFPQYDFVKNIGGDKVNVKLLLPPGVEAHAFEPKPGDITEINNAGIFIYTGEFMEPWAHDIIKGIDKKIIVVDASEGIDVIKTNESKHEETEHESEEEHHHHEGVDPHIWLDFDNAKIMAENIAKSLINLDPQNSQYYQNNLLSFQLKLTELDNKYNQTLSACKSKTIIYGGHYAFGYQSRRYGLEYVSAQGFSPDSEPTARDMIDLTKQIKENKIKYIFHEELTSPKIAETLARETNAKLLLLNGAHNLTKKDYESGETFISLMENNLDNLATGLDCQKPL